MALGDPYINAAELAAYIGIDDSYDNALLLSAATAASEWVNKFCQRQFNKTTTATARTYVAGYPTRLEVDDFHTTTDLIVATDTTDTGTYATITDYVLQPFNGVEAGMTGFPYRKIVTVDSESFPLPTGRARVRVTAQWGWAAVPESVTLATEIVGGFLFNLKDSPLGVASFGESGIIRVRDVPQAAMLLTPYQHPAKTGPLVA